MIVRKARNMQDVENMVALGAEMHAESIYASSPYVPAKLLAYGKGFLDNPQSGVLLLAEDNDKCHGMMAGWGLRSFFNDDVCVRDMILYIRKEKRGGTTAIRLVSAFEDWAKSIGAKSIDIGISAGINNERATKFYTALGFKPRGVTLSKEV